MQLTIEYMPLSELKAYSNNAKIHTAEQIEQIKKSIQEFGMNDPIAIWKNNEIIEGHGRLIACTELGINEVPVIRIDNLTDEQRKAYMLIHNKLTMNTDFDIDVLNMELEDIAEVDMTEFGFSVAEEGEDEDEYGKYDDVSEDGYEGEIKEEAVCQKGDVWKLGQHVLICGDSTEESTFEKVMDEKAELLFTSPPYSDIRTYNGDKDLDVEHIAEFIKATSPHVNYMCVNLGIQRIDREIYPYWDTYIEKAHEAGLKLMAWNVWDKMTCGSIGMYKSLVPIRHEWLFVFGKEYKDLNLTWAKKKSSIYENGRRRNVRQADGTYKESSEGVTSNAFKKMESLVKIPDKETLDSVTEQFCEHNPDVCKLHPAVFPVYLPAEYIIAFTNEGDTVIEPFGGSGTTLIACEQLNRKCVCVELDERYCDAIIDRWQTFTGEVAEKVE